MDTTTKDAVTNCNFSCNLQSNSTLKRCFLAKDVCYAKQTLEVLQHSEQTVCNNAKSSPPIFMQLNGQSNGGAASSAFLLTGN